jgi:hypothetical protein
MKYRDSYGIENKDYYKFCMKYFIIIQYSGSLTSCSLVPASFFWQSVQTFLDLCGVCHFFSSRNFGRLVPSILSTC